MTKIKKIKIGDLGKIITGNTPPTNNSKNYGGKYPFIKPTDMTIDQRHVYNYPETYSEISYKKYKNSYIPKGATGVVTIGTVGEKIFQAHEDCFTNQSVNTVIANEDYFDRNYVFYLLKYNLPKVEGANPGTASGRHHVSKSNFSSIKIDVVEDLKTQKKIAKILSNYDDLIENNLKQIKLLEEKARLTYEEWFLRFRVDGVELEIDSESGLPFGWKTNKFKNVLKFKTGKLNSNAVVENGKYDFYTCAKEIFKTNTFTFDEEVVLLGGNNATGNFSLFYVNGKFDVYQRTYVITSTIFPSVYIYFVIQNYLPFFKNISSGATTKFLTMQILNLMPIVKPSNEILDKFEEKIKPIFDRVLNLNQQNQNLKEARDILLPRLMTGVIEL